jgi:hypothetical protein
MKDWIIDLIVVGGFGGAFIVACFLDWLFQFVRETRARLQRLELTPDRRDDRDPRGKIMPSKWVPWK